MRIQSVGTDLLIRHYIRFFFELQLSSHSSVVRIVLIMKRKPQVGYYLKLSFQWFQHPDDAFFEIRKNVPFKNSHSISTIFKLGAVLANSMLINAYIQLENILLFH